MNERVYLNLKCPIYYVAIFRVKCLNKIFYIWAIHWLQILDEIKYLRYQTYRYVVYIPKRYDTFVHCKELKKCFTSSLLSQLRASSMFPNPFSSPDGNLR